jgi:hypothetical protein
MSQRRHLREYQLVALMLSDRQALYAEFTRVMGDDGGSRDPRQLTDRDVIAVILEKEFPAAEFSEQEL